jgi:four helix bundle protein
MGKQESPKLEIRNPKQIQMTKMESNKSETQLHKEPGIPFVKESRTNQYDLEDRTFLFAKNVRGLFKQIPKTVGNIEDAKQLVRASGSIGANYIEANESLSKRDFLMRIKICRKEAKESRYWLRLIDAGDDSTVRKYRDELVQEATELTSIFGAILRKSE